MRKTKGITLIALIITIIVMLILVAVSISILINSGLIGKAQKAKTDTQEAYAREQTLGESVNINGTMYTIDELVNLRTFTITDNNIGVTETFYYDNSITTWADFVASDFSNSNWEIRSDYIYYNGGCVSYNNDGVKLNDNINISTSYYLAYR